MEDNWVQWIRIDPLTISEQYECKDIREIVNNLSEMQQLYSPLGSPKMVMKVTDTIVGRLLPRLKKLQAGIYEREKAAPDQEIVG